jgi:hypothetical protein
LFTSHAQHPKKPTSLLQPTAKRVHDFLSARLRFAGTAMDAIPQADNGI